MCWLREASALVLEPGSVGSKPQGCDLEGAKAGSGPPLVKEFQEGVMGTKDPEVKQLKQSLVMGPGCSRVTGAVSGLSLPGGWGEQAGGIWVKTEDKEQTGGKREQHPELGKKELELEFKPGAKFATPRDHRAPPLHPPHHLALTLKLPVAPLALEFTGLMSRPRCRPVARACFSRWLSRRASTVGYFCRM